MKNSNIKIFFVLLMALLLLPLPCHAAQYPIQSPAQHQHSTEQQKTYQLPQWINRNTVCVSLLALAVAYVGVSGRNQGMAHAQTPPALPTVARTPVLPIPPNIPVATTTVVAPILPPDPANTPEILPASAVANFITPNMINVEFQKLLGVTGPAAVMEMMCKSYKNRPYLFVGLHSYEGVRQKVEQCLTLTVSLVLRALRPAL